MKYYNYFTWIYTVTRIVGSAGKAFRDKKKVLKGENVVLEGGINKKLLSIWKINAKKGKMNCANCAIAVDTTLAGKPSSALPWTYIKRMEKGKIVNKISYIEGTNISVLEKEYGKKFLKEMSVQKITEMLLQNQRGIVFAYNKNGTIGHFFNVVNENGVIKFLDGQTGKSAVLKFDFYELLPTNF